jgi:hypothetical protein
MWDVRCGIEDYLVFICEKQTNESSVDQMMVPRSNGYFNFQVQCYQKTNGDFIRITWMSCEEIMYLVTCSSKRDVIIPYAWVSVGR